MIKENTPAHPEIELTSKMSMTGIDSTNIYATILKAGTAIKNDSLDKALLTNKNIIKM